MRVEGKESIGSKEAKLGTSGKGKGGAALRSGGTNISDYFGKNKSETGISNTHLPSPGNQGQGINKNHAMRG